MKPLVFLRRLTSATVHFSSTPSAGVGHDFRASTCKTAVIRNGHSSLTMLLVATIFVPLTVKPLRLDADTIFAATVTGQVDKFDSNGGGYELATQGLGQPDGIAIDADGDSLVSDQRNNRILKITPDGTVSVFADSAHQGVSSPAGIAFDALGNLYVLNVSANNILKITPSGVSTVFAHSYTLTDNVPYCLAFDAAGNLFVSYGGDQVAGSGLIIKYSTQGVATVFASGLNLVAGLAFDPSGNLYAALPNDDEIEKYTHLGIGSVFASPNGLLMGPFGLGFGSDGELYVSNDGAGNILKYTTAGVGSVFADTISGAPADAIAVEAAPEPSTLALLLSGVGLMWLKWHRRGVRWIPVQAPPVFH